LFFSTGNTLSLPEDFPGYFCLFFSELAGSLPGPDGSGIIPDAAIPLR